MPVHVVLVDGREHPIEVPGGDLGFAIAAHSPFPDAVQGGTAAGATVDVFAGACGEPAVRTKVQYSENRLGWPLEPPTTSPAAFSVQSSMLAAIRTVIAV